MCGPARYLLVEQLTVGSVLEKAGSPRHRRLDDLRRGTQPMVEHTVCTVGISRLSLCEECGGVRVHWVCGLEHTSLPTVSKTSRGIAPVLPFGTCATHPVHGESAVH